MAGATVKARQGARSGSQVAELTKAHNKLVADLELLRASVQGGTGVTATAAAALLAPRVAGLDGRDPDGVVVP